MAFGFLIIAPMAYEYLYFFLQKVPSISFLALLPKILISSPPTYFIPICPKKVFINTKTSLSHKINQKIGLLMGQHDFPASLVTPINRVLTSVSLY